MAEKVSTPERVPDYVTQLRQCQAALEEKEKELSRLEAERLNVILRIDAVEEDIESLKQSLDDLQLRVRAGEYGERGYHLLLLEGKREEWNKRDLTGYVMRHGKYVICNEYVMLALNEKPAILEENPLSSLTARSIDATLDGEIVDTVTPGSVASYPDVTCEYYAALNTALPPSTVRKVGSAYINQGYLESVWRVLDVDERAEIGTVLARKEDRHYRATYHLRVQTERGVAVIMGMRWRK